ncbi:hypothetical protein BCR34DRAFT_552253 [Clohesyomyces aquaticus]|uniref:C2H2-type domain-containing protein n=1 Tax=Clohesyomyces aquaticus TaxID=1231657 RepID=A0A1Y2ABV9_9PLEO|nr:hypothetical protein BCR34DRAFT_552253 [Clohesyomyces aquaticus]
MNITAPNSNALSTIAANDTLFLKQNDAPSFEAFSLNQIISYLAVVHEGLRVFHRARSEHDDEWLIAQGLEFGLSFDEVFIANYEHLLLRLQSQLVDALTRKVIEALLGGNHDKRQHRLLNWFFEYAGNQRPLSTTWPWSIKPSLAVLWGVCWMFYDNASQNGNSRVPQTRFLQEEWLGNLGWGAPQPNQSDFDFGRELITGTQTAAGEQQSPFGHAPSGPRDLRHLSLHHVPTHQHSLNRGSADHRGPITGRRGSSAFQGPTASAAPTYNTYASASHASSIRPRHTNNFSPEFPGFATTQVFTGSIPQQQLHVDTNTEDWPFSFSSPLPQRHGSEGHLNAHTPVIQITDSNGSQAPDNVGFAPPQHLDYSSYNTYEHSLPRQPQAPHLNLNNISNFPPSQYNMGGNCDHSPIQNTQIRMHERTPSTNSNSNMPTPVSIAAPHSPLRSPITERGHERRPSNTSSLAPERQDSEEQSSQDGDENDDLSPRRNHAYKRSEEPPRNREGKMFCKHKECTNMTFDRKCEWSKHMDKHDRPYKCNVKGCEKLQGFTYSGGLLRHEREVHKMHGGTKKSLFCPFTDCKRSSGAGFTRKENLAEHVRRVHRRTSMSSDMGNMIIPRPFTRDGSTEVQRIPEEPRSPYQRTLETQEDSQQLSAKRKRVSDAGLSDEGDESDLRAELKRLRKENAEKDTRLRSLEAAVAMLQQQGRR